MEINNNDTLTGICNSAMAMVGHTDFIDDIESDNPVAKTLRIVLEQACKEVQAHEYATWSELEEEVALVKREERDDGLVEWNLPIRLLSVISCFKVFDKKRIPVRHEIVGGYLLCEEKEDVRIRFIRFSFEPDIWSVELKTCIIKLLSARILASLVKDYSGAQRLEQQFWAYDFPLWVGNHKNKVRRSDSVGDDKVLTNFYY